MLKPPKTPNRSETSRLEIKSKLEAEFRRFSIDKSELTTFAEFSSLIEKFHKLHEIPFIIFYTDPIHGDLLPINNDDNLARAITSAFPLLRLFVLKKGKLSDLPSNRTLKRWSQDFTCLIKLLEKS